MNFSIAQIEVGNAKSRITGLDPELFRLLRHELSFQESEGGTRRFLQSDGSVKVSHWDGFRRLLDNKGLFPSGLIPRLVRLLQKWGAAYQVTDRRERLMEGMPLWTMPKDFRLRDYQEVACNAAEKVGRGVIDSPPRTGKTIMMAELIRRVASPTVITSPTEAIAAQTHAKLLELFASNDWTGLADCSEDFFLLTGGAPKTRKTRAALKRATVFVATADTAASMSQAWWDRILCLIVDERHHQAARTYHKMNTLAVNAYWRWGFTGTNYRSKEGEQVALEACLGRVVARYTIPDMVARGVLVGGQVVFWPIDRPGIKSMKFSEGYRAGIVEDELRNRMIVYSASELVRAGRKVLILVHHIEHGERLQAMLAGSRFVQGADGPEVRKAVAQLDSGELRCLIGSPVVGEGLDCPAADALVYAKGYKAKVTHVQDIFRVLTAGPAKKDAIVVDFADRHNKVLMEHSVERMRNYIGMGLTCSVRENLPVDMTQLALYR